MSNLQFANYFAYCLLPIVLSIKKNVNMEMYDNENTLQKSFDTGFLTEELLQAQWAEFIELKKRITELYYKKKHPVTIVRYRNWQCPHTKTSLWYQRNLGHG
jgi:hypothetical protein